MAQRRRYEIGQEGSAEEQGEMPCLKVLPRCFGSERATASVVPGSLVKLEITPFYVRGSFLARTLQFCNI